MSLANKHNFMSTFCFASLVIQSLGSRITVRRSALNGSEASMHSRHQMRAKCFCDQKTCGRCSLTSRVFSRSSRNTLPAVFVSLVLNRNFSGASLFIAIALAIALVRSIPLDSETSARVSGSTVIANASGELVGEPARTELPRIITWRPLPVVEHKLHRRDRSRPAPKTTRKLG